jgi:23S rRNA (cytosine1962-C5)-methyltransferase
MALPQIKLKRQRPERIAHPWIYDNEIEFGPGPEFENGGLVRISDSRGHAIGIGYLNGRSKIAVRYLTRQPEVMINASFWKKRVAQAYEYRQQRYAGEGGLPTAYRLVHGEADGIPGLVVDVYGKFAVAQFLALGLEPWRDVLVAALMEVAGLTGLYERSDSAVRRLEGLEEQSGVLAGDAPPDILELEDAGSILLADLKTGAKTGLFLDQRLNQLAAARQAVGRDVLNCFSYTGIFTLRAARLGAKTTTDVEASETFNALNKKQWERNGMKSAHQTITDNVFDYLHTLDSKGYKTDMIILDPPAFTKNRASREGAARGYNEINRMALRMLNPGGVLVTCSCSHHLDATEFREIVHGAAHDANRSLKLIEQRGQPADHPVLLNAPESEYLKCLILAVE